MNTVAVFIALFIIAPDGSIRRQVEPRPSLNACWAEAKAFVLRDPAEFEGVALGAGCLVRPERQS